METSKLIANSFKHKFLLDNGQSAELDIPITVESKIVPTVAAAEKVFADMEARIESINVSFVFKARK